MSKMSAKVLSVEQELIPDHDSGGYGVRAKANLAWRYEVYRDELETLRDMLVALGLKLPKDNDNG